MGVKSKDYETFQLISKYINENYKLIDRNQLFKTFHYNKNYFYEVLKKHTGMTLVQYIQNVRLEKAEELLRTTDLGVRKISETVGYNNTTYFYKIFVNKYNSTPKNYRIKFKTQRL